MIKHLNLTISGRVQGVFYRDSTKRRADELGLCGWVCNEADGSVYCEVEGEKEELDELVSWCKEGSRHAVVEKVEVEAGEVKGFSSFEITW